MITLDEALAALKSYARPLPAEEIAVLKSYGRVLREDVRSPHAIPPFDKSAMDGYAVRAADVAGASAARPVLLTILEDIPAGRVGRFRLRPGAAARIMTGAPLPEGADAVVMVEDTEAAPAGVLVKKAIATGANVAPAGGDVARGARVLAAGTLLKAADLGMIASTGRSTLAVATRPRVRIVSTGSEIVRPGRALPPGRIYDANGYSLAGLAIRWGADVRFLGVASDRKGALERKIARAADADVLVLSGGVSVGDYDLVQGILLELGTEQIFHKVRIKPGMPTFAGMRGRRFVLGLPGHPVSCMVTFTLFAGTLLDIMLGKREIGPRRGRATLAAPLRMRPNRRKFLRGMLREQDGRLAVEPFHAQESSILTSMVAADVLIDVPDGVAEAAAGSLVDIVYL
jgi:molybdopterin molybdotransferase